MQVKFRFLFLILLLPLNCLGQQASNYFNAALEKADYYLRNDSLDKALTEFQNAQIEARAKGIDSRRAQDGINEVFDKIRKERDRALDAEKKTRAETKRAERKTKEGQALALLGRSYFSQYHDNDITLGFLFAKYAWKKASTSIDIRNALYSAIFQPPTEPNWLFYRRLQGHSGHVVSAAFSPDGKKNSDSVL